MWRDYNRLITLLVFIGVFSANHIQNVQGISCYICSTVAKEKEHTCSHVVSNRIIKNCSSFENYCLRISGIVDGESIAMRSCSTDNWKKVIGSGNNCTDSGNIPSLSVKIHEKEVDLEDGRICICDSDHCNGAQRSFRPNYALIFLNITFGIFVLFKLR